MSAIEPYQISIPDSELHKLTQKLSLSSFPDELEEAGWDYGAPLSDIKRLAVYWKDGFNWRDIESKINELPNYRTAIQADGFEALNIHFVHQRSEVEAAIPLLFSHGWPGNFLEVSKLLPLLNGDGKSTPAFHIVAPSLPNYGFSEGTKKKGFGLAQYAEICHKLMQRLGYKEYVTQGGDWGCMITRTMGFLYPQHCKASHINMAGEVEINIPEPPSITYWWNPLMEVPVRYQVKIMVRGNPPKWTSQPFLALQHALTPYSSKTRKGIQRSEWFLKQGSGYRLEQSTKPQTLGYALADSPVGLLAWIYEKLHDWTDNYAWTDDEILTWVSIYWFSVSGPAANLRIYYEAVHSGFLRPRTEQWIPHVKLGLAYFPQELTVPPKAYGRTMGPVVLESEHESGGHFAATEKPEAIAADLQKMFGKGGGGFNVVQGRDGYSSVSSRL